MLQTVIDKLKTVNCDAVIERGIVFLLVFTPLAIGTVQAWSIAVMEIVVFVVFSAWLLKSLRDPVPESKSRSPKFHALKRRLALIFLVLAGISIVQIIPLPSSVLGFISPKSSAFYQAFTDDPPGAWRTISISRDASVGELFKLLSYALVFIVIVNHYDTEEKIKTVFRTVLFMGCFLAAIAVVQKMTWNGRLFWLFPIQKELIPAGHPTGPYINRNHFAGYMEMAAPVGMGFFLYTVSKIKEMSHLSDARFTQKIASFLDNERLATVTFGLVAVMVMTGALFLTFSRGAIVGFLGSVIFFVIISRSRRSIRKKWNYIVLIGVLIAVAVISTSWTMIEMRMKRVGTEGTARVGVFQDALMIVKDFPVLGAGLGTFPHIYPLYQSRHPMVFFDHAENDYLETATDVGIAGLTALMAGIAVFFFTLMKQWRERHNTYVICAAAGGMTSIVAMAIHSIADFNMRIPANALLLTVIAATTCATVFHVKSKNHGEAASPHARHIIGRFTA